MSGKIPTGGRDAAVRELDLRGLRCPLPALRTRKSLNAMALGERLIVLADDPLAAIDIAHLCSEDGHRLVKTRSEAGAMQFEIVAGME
nr:sulfurtransferase TusA family protein [Jiella mangrovi]